MRSDPQLASRLAVARRHSLVSGAAATAVMAGLAAVVWAYLDTPYFQVGNRTIGVLPLAAAVLALAVLLVGELTWPRPTGATRTATLNPRTPWSLIPRGWAAGAVLAAVALLGVIALAARMATADDRAIVRVEPGWEGDPTPLLQRFAIPGWHYGGPQVVGLVAALLLVCAVVYAAAHRATIRRADPEVDNRFRVDAVVRAMRVAIAGTMVTLAGDAYFVGRYWSSTASGPADGAVGELMTLAAPVVAVGAMVLLLLPTRRPRPPVAIRVVRREGTLS